VNVTASHMSHTVLVKFAVVDTNRTQRSKAQYSGLAAGYQEVAGDVTDVKNWPGAKTESPTKQSQSQGTDPRSICHDWTIAAGMTEFQVAVPLAL
jgi:hypothetical protein